MHIYVGTQTNKQIRNWERHTKTRLSVFGSGKGLDCSFPLFQSQTWKGEKKKKGQIRFISVTLVGQHVTRLACTTPVPPRALPPPLPLPPAPNWFPALSAQVNQNRSNRPPPPAARTQGERERRRGRTLVANLASSILLFPFLLRRIRD